MAGKLISTIILVLALLNGSAAIYAQSSSFTADTQKFGVRLFLVPDSDAFVEMWSKPETPKITFYNRAPIGSEFAGILLYWGGGTDARGNCNIELQTSVLEHGSVIASGPRMPVCKDHAPPKPGTLALSDTIIDLVASGEPAKLVVQVNVSDNISNETLTVIREIEVVQ